MKEVKLIKKSKLSAYRLFFAPKRKRVSRQFVNRLTPFGKENDGRGDGNDLSPDHDRQRHGAEKTAEELRDEDLKGEGRGEHAEHEFIPSRPAENAFRAEFAAVQGVEELQHDEETENRRRDRVSPRPDEIEEVFA